MTFSDTPPHSQAHDRAHATAGTVFAIVINALRAWPHGEPVDLTGVRAAIEKTLRDEFNDIARQARGEREIPDS